MSQTIIEAVKQVSPKGLEAMLQEVEESGMRSGNYFLVRDAKVQLTRIKLELPEDIDEMRDRKGFEEKWAQLLEARLRLTLEAAEYYRLDGNYEAAGDAFTSAGQYQKAIEMLRKDGTADSMYFAGSLAMEHTEDYELGIELILQSGHIFSAFHHLDEARDKISIDQRKRLEGMIVKAVYRTAVERMADKIEHMEGVRPEGDTLAQLRAGREDEFIFVNNVDFDPDFRRTIHWAVYSEDPEIMQIGIELLALQMRYVRDDKLDRLVWDDKFLRGKLTGDDRFVRYFLWRAEESRDAGATLFDFFAHRAISLLEYHNRYADALQVSDDYFPDNHTDKIYLLEALGDHERLAAVWKAVGNPINFALSFARCQRTA